MMDGTPTHRLNDFICHVLKNNQVDHGASQAQSLQAPEEITFQQPEQVASAVEAAKKQFAELRDAHDLKVLSYQGFGKGLIKRFKSSPDSFVQMVIQLAYYKMYGQSRPTYESAATRRFQHGRTETCRSVSTESVAFCEAMTSSTATVAEQITAFRAAIKSHGEYINAASAGLGVDRHLFGLKQLVPKGAELPALFKDPAYSYSCKWYISSSQLSSEHFNGYGWGEVIPEGFGIAYMINENDLNFNIVSRHLGCDKMAYYLREAADEMKAVLETELAAPKPKL
jgi:carnitine O-acetyltransferase